MLTVIDKMDYKRKNKISFTKAEQYFFTGKDFRQIISLLLEADPDKDVVMQYIEKGEKRKK